jgi:hypothetical protein
MSASPIVRESCWRRFEPIYANLNLDDRSFVTGSVSDVPVRTDQLTLAVSVMALRQVLTDLGKKLTRTEGLGYKVIAACHARFLLISAQGIGTDRDDRDRL